MKKQFLLFSLFIALFSACKKESYDATKQAVIDETRIQKYIAANNLTMTKDPRGFYYQIIKQVDGDHPTDTSTIQVTYTGKLLNGSTFDAADVATIDLSTAIKGWQYGLPLVGADGSTTYSRIRLIIPSALAYGSTASSSVPANSVLDFTIDLLGIEAESN